MSHKLYVYAFNTFSVQPVVYSGRVADMKLPGGIVQVHANINLNAVRCRALVGPASAHCLDNAVLKADALRQALTQSGQVTGQEFEAIIK